MLTHNIDYFQSKPVNIPKITILLDHGYHPEHLRQELKKMYPQMIKKIKFELSTKPSRQEKAATGRSGERSIHCSVGEANVPMLGWSVVRFWLKTTKEP